jgi:hypothetical protein
MEAVSMKKNLLAAFLVVCLVSVPLLNAAIIDWNCADDGDGAIVMDTPAFSYEGEDLYTLTMSGTQNWAPAHVEGDFTTDTELDPKVWIIEDIENQTTFAWTGYQIVIGMTKTFTISSVVAPDNWTFSITATAAGTIPNGGGSGYVGIVDYYANPGYELAIGDSADFGLKIEFLGTVAFCTEQTPIPEPATLGLFSIGALAFMRRRR